MENLEKQIVAGSTRAVLTLDHATIALENRAGFDRERRRRDVADDGSSRRYFDSLMTNDVTDDCAVDHANAHVDISFDPG
jgi:hypothetical protein